MSSFKIIPFDFQDRAVKEVAAYWAAGLQSVLLNSPPSSGKTVMATLLINLVRAAMTGGMKRIFFFVHLDNLQDSTAKALSSSYTVKQINSVGGKKGSTKIRETAEIHICMVQTFNSRFDRQNWKDYLKPEITDLCIFDECHRGEHDKVITYLRNEQPKIKILGLTGTPKKMKNAKMPLSFGYDAMVHTVNEIELIEMNPVPRTVPPYLIIPESGTEKLDLHTVPVQKSGYNAGEYNTSALSNHMRKKRTVYSGFVDLWNKYAKRTKTLVFCVDIMHCIDTCEYFINNGIRAKFYTSGKAKPVLKDPADEKQVLMYNKRLKEYERYCDAEHKMLTGSKHALLNQWGRDFDVMINSGVFTTGFDDDTIKTIGLLTPTNSENLYLQMVGRGKRYLEGKGFYFVIDMAECVDTFGHPCAPRNYSLNESPRKKKKGDAPTKKCPQCGQSVPASDMFCSSIMYDGFVPTGICGFEFVRTRIEKETKFSLVKWESFKEMNAPQVLREFQKSKRTTISDVYEYYSYRREQDPNFSPNWFFYTLYELFGVQGLIEFAEDTGRNTDGFLENIQRITNGQIPALDDARSISKTL